VKTRVVAAALLALVIAQPAAAHIGSPDVYFEGSAGDYRMLVVVRMPRVIPGVAEIEVRSLSDGLRDVRVTPMRIRGLGSDLSPVADIAERVADRPGVYRAQLWLMLRGAWKVHIVANGDRGTGELSVPVGAVSSETRPMQRGMRWILGVLAVLLVAGAIAIVGAGVREGMTRPGTDPSPATIRRARIAMIRAAVLIGGLVGLGDLWWRAAAADADRAVYKTPQVTATLVDPRTLSLKIASSNTERWAERVGLNDLVPDHGHLMHLFLIRDPGMDFLVHLHPTQESRERFVQELPSMPAGRYRVFADIVHGTGFPETEIGEVALPQIVSGLPRGDDSLTPALSLLAGPQTDSAPLTGGFRMFWLNSSGTLRAGEPIWLKFHVEDSAGRPAANLEPYMGMAGHLVVVRIDWQVFAHLHPAGSPPMAALELANRPSMAGFESATDGRTAARDPANGAATVALEPAKGPGMAVHAGHAVVDVAPAFRSASSSEITFPYGFPQAGYYRLFVQVKRAGRIETGVFDAQVSESGHLGN